MGIITSNKTENTLSGVGGINPQAGQAGLGAIHNPQVPNNNQNYNNPNNNVDKSSIIAGLNLSKGSTINLSKSVPGVNLSKLKFCLGWQTPNMHNGVNFDLDAQAVMLTNLGKMKVPSQDFIFYNNPSHPNGSLIHHGDSVIGSGAGDDEVISADLMRIPDHVTQIVLIASIFEGVKRNQTFGQVQNAYIRVVDEMTNREIMRYLLTEDYSNSHAVIVGSITRGLEGWSFNAIGEGVQGSMEHLIARYL